MSSIVWMIIAIFELRGELVTSVRGCVNFYLKDFLLYVVILPIDRRALIPFELYLKNSRFFSL